MLSCACRVRGAGHRFLSFAGRVPGLRRVVPIFSPFGRGPGGLGNPAFGRGEGRTWKFALLLDCRQFFRHFHQFPSFSSLFISYSWFFFYLFIVCLRLFFIFMLLFIDFLSVFIVFASFAVFFHLFHHYFIVCFVILSMPRLQGVVFSSFWAQTWGLELHAVDGQWHARGGQIRLVLSKI